MDILVLLVQRVEIPFVESEVVVAFCAFFGEGAFEITREIELVDAFEAGLEEVQDDVLVFGSIPGTYQHLLAEQQLSVQGFFEFNLILHLAQADRDQILLRDPNARSKFMQSLPILRVFAISLKFYLRWLDPLLRKRLKNGVVLRVRKPALDPFLCKGDGDDPVIVPQG